MGSKSASRVETRDATSIVRERYFSLDSGDDSILAALAHLRREHVTGTLFVDIACGGAATLRFREEHSIEFPDVAELDKA